MNRSWARAGAVAVYMALGLPSGATEPTAARLLEFSPGERAAIARHGPWPPPPARDPGNAASGNPEAIEYGRRLFAERRLAPDASIACTSCHDPQRAFTDGVPRAIGRLPLARNTPSLWNAVLQRWQGWDGAADSLWSQALRALTAPDEMAATPASVAAVVRGRDDLSAPHRRAFGALPGDDEALAVQVAKALGAYVATLVSARTPFDDFRDAIVAGDAAAAAAYPLAAQRGLRLFIGRGRCALCHLGPLFSSGEFGDTGLSFFVLPGVVDPGRHRGIALLRASRFNLLGPFAERREGEDVATRHVAAQHRNFGEFKIPSLRGVAQTAPYGHDGQLATLDAVLHHYAELDLDRLHADGERILEPLHLSASESADLAAFLHSLSAPANGQK